MFGLSFLYPLFLIGAAAVAIPIVLHLFRRKTEVVVDFPAVRLLQKGTVEQQRRRTLRELLLLALRVSALLLLALAFARPYFASGQTALAAPTTVVAIDVSMSMTAPGQFEAARAAARRAVEATPATHLVALVTFADSATVVVPPTSDRGGVLAALNSVAPGAGGTRFRTALARSAEAIAGGEGRIVVITDLQQAGWEAADEGAVPDGIAVDVAAVRAPASNLAVTAVRREGDAVVAAVHNFGARPARVPVRLHVDDKPVTQQVVNLAPQSASDIRLVAPLPPRGAGSVRIDDAEGYQPDNARFFVLDPPSPAAIIVLTAEPPSSSNAGLYVERALSLADDGRAFQPRVIDGQAFSAMTPEQRGQPAAMFILGTRTLDRTGRDAIASYLRGGGQVFLALGGDVDVGTLNDVAGTDLGASSEPNTVAGGSTIVAADARHPIFRPFLAPGGGLGDVQVTQYRRLNDQAGRAVLARYAGGATALTEQPVERGRLLVFTSDLDNQWNRFPINPAFVPFAIETAKYLAQGREQRHGYTLPEFPAGLEPQPGVHVLPGAAGGNQQRVAINVDVRESNPASGTAEEFTTAITRLNRSTAEQATTQAADQEEKQRLWQLGLLVMFLALAGEGLLGRRAS